MNIYCFSTLSFAKLQFKSVINKAFHKHGVASFTDAWIETEAEAKSILVTMVASFTDAWIETLLFSFGCSGSWSHLLQMRGLKLDKEKGKEDAKLVASFTDAWIETYFHYFSTSEIPSHLLQMRGLKHIQLIFNVTLLCRIFYRCVD